MKQKNKNSMSYFQLMFGCLFVMNLLAETAADDNDNLRPNFNIVKINKNTSNQSGTVIIEDDANMNYMLSKLKKYCFLDFRCD
jgi:hypothetical protein